MLVFEMTTSRYFVDNTFFGELVQYLVCQSDTGKADSAVPPQGVYGDDRPVEVATLTVEVVEDPVTDPAFVPLEEVVEPIVGCENQSQAKDDDDRGWNKVHFPLQNHYAWFFIFEQELLTKPLF